LGLHSKRCLMLVKEAKQWDEAEFYCRNHSGGHLAPVSDWGELEDAGHLCGKVNESRFATVVNPRGLGCYLGGRRANASEPREGWGFPWSPCVSFNESFWNDGEPNNAGGCETCLAVKYESETQSRQPGKLPYMLNDVSCNVQLPFLCALKRCDDVGCDLASTCKTEGDNWATCKSDWQESVGYKCSCSQSFKEDSTGITCIHKN
jgi:hypothetical protein